jgi:TonB family protein
MPRQPSQEPVEMPGMSGLSGTSYSATGGRVYYTVKSIRADRGGTSQSRLIDFTTKFKEAFSQTSPGARLTYDRVVNAGGFSGKHYRVSSPNGRGLVRVYSAARRIYVLEVTGGDENDAPVGWFLESFTISELPHDVVTQTDGGSPGVGNRVKGRTEGGGPPPEVKVLTDFRLCACDPLGNLSEQPAAEAQLTRDAIICTEGDLELTDEAIKHQFNGNVILRVELLANGTVGGIQVVQSQPYGLERKAIEAARQYKFCPALKDGQPVRQIMELTCTFSITTIYTDEPATKARVRRRP